MQNTRNSFKQILEEITESTKSDQEKMNLIGVLISSLSLVNQNVEISLASEAGIVIACGANRQDMAAQFYLMRAKSEISQAGEFIAEMKNLKMAIEWFGFALESADNRYKELEKKLNVVWSTTQAYIDEGYKLLNEKPYVGAVAYCHSTAGQIYSTHYLQLKLYYLKTSKPWRAKIANYKIFRWIGLDDLLVINKKSRLHLYKTRMNCLKSLHRAVYLFRQEKAYDYVVDSYFDLSLEHHSFNDTIRSKFYMIVARIWMKSCDLSSNKRLVTRLESLKELPLIGSNRNEDISRVLPNL